MAARKRRAADSFSHSPRIRSGADALSAMLIKSIVFSILLLTAESAHAQPVPTGYDFRGIIPHDWRKVPPPRGVNAVGFASPRGDAWIVFKAEPARRSVVAQLTQLSRVRGGHITYERNGGTWIVVSGFNGNRIFYRKAMLACGGRAWHYLEFEYPAAQKRAFDDFVTRSSRALGDYGSSGCNG